MSLVRRSGNVLVHIWEKTDSNGDFQIIVDRWVNNAPIANGRLFGLDDQESAVDEATKLISIP